MWISAANCFGKPDRAGCYNLWSKMTMLYLASTVRLLKKERDDARKIVLGIDRALKVLNGLGGSKGTRRTMSAHARKRIAAAQRKRWAKWKAAKKQVSRHA